MYVLVFFCHLFILCAFLKHKNRNNWIRTTVIHHIFCTHTRIKTREKHEKHLLSYSFLHVQYWNMFSNFTIRKCFKFLICDLLSFFIKLKIIKPIYVDLDRNAISNIWIILSEYIKKSICIRLSNWTFKTNCFWISEMHLFSILSRKWWHKIR